MPRSVRERDAEAPPASMDNPAKTLEELKTALETLSPRDMAAWTEWVESRLTERLRLRQGHARPSLCHACTDLDEDY